MTGCHLAYVQTEIRSVVIQFEIQVHSVCIQMLLHALMGGRVCQRHIDAPACDDSPVQFSAGHSTAQDPACLFIDVPTTY